ncbi:MAG TPA: aminomethyl-transferring glycine dehydrogenase subunit GcvPA [Thermoanaerobaculia bacterium]|nr:aminomethyl-transferring glycine dehydrogenase subunit GcvPA [Thermoanaerobaculia bacterium]HQR67430.1 aminomethyl-transferring glycine dehydrogenase subunit GcvPA [Thermoanaerobaculia bacterium]
MRYIPHSPEEQAVLLSAVGVRSVDELFATVPKEVLRHEPPALPPPASEIEVRRAMAAMAARNANLSEWTSLLGAGLYAHHTPAFVPQLLTRGEFLTAYTPYQPEVSQGTLTAIWEFQSHVALLTELDVANASMYEGASAFVEAVLMAERLTKKRTKVVVSKGVHPEYRRCLKTYLANFPFTIVEVPVGEGGATDRAALEKAVDETTIAVAVQSPNVLGVVESWAAAADAAHGRGALAIGVVNEMFSLAVLKGPGALGIDIAAGEAASFGVPPSFGGPLVGFLACRDAMKRQIPGRLVGRTTDANGKTAFCLTLSTREQHIRREKATSNICTNQGLFALAATMTLSVLGRQGLRETALQCLSKAEYLKAGVRAIPGPFSVAFSGRTFNEFAIHCGPPVGDVLARCEEKKILGGVPLARIAPEEEGWRDLLLVAVTERTPREGLDAFLDVLRSFPS